MYNCHNFLPFFTQDLANAGNMNAELRKLQFYGPGPKAAVAELDAKAEGYKSHLVEPFNNRCRIYSGFHFLSAQ